jgi:hypothetical protein
MYIPAEVPESVPEEECERIGKMFAKLTKTFHIKIELPEAAVFKIIPA